MRKPIAAKKENPAKITSCRMLQIYKLTNLYLLLPPLDFTLTALPFPRLFL
jgi:hypothetical protein